MPEFYNKIAPSYFCSFFGLILIQKRAVECDYDLTQEMKEDFKQQTIDYKKENFGFIGSRMVCLDYAKLIPVK